MTGVSARAWIARSTASRSGASSASVELTNTRSRWSGVRITTARCLSPAEESVDVGGLSTESGHDRQVDILRQARFTPSLDGDPVDEAEPPFALRRTPRPRLPRRGSGSRGGALRVEDALLRDETGCHLSARCQGEGSADSSRASVAARASSTDMVRSSDRFCSARPTAASRHWAIHACANAGSASLCHGSSIARSHPGDSQVSASRARQEVARRHQRTGRCVLASAPRVSDRGGMTWWMRAGGRSDPRRSGRPP